MSEEGKNLRFLVIGAAIVICIWSSMAFICAIREENTRRMALERAPDKNIQVVVSHETVAVAVGVIGEAE